MINHAYNLSTEHRAQSQPIVSFCIPVYNNAEAAQKIVNGLLVSEASRFEVVACNDASTDNAHELLSQINDPRFRYIRNEKNLGAHKNWLKSLELGRGEWLFLVMGRDRLRGENIGRLIDLLEGADKDGITYIQDGYSKRRSVKTYTGIEAILKFVALSHPTGSIFLRRVFDEIPDKEYYFTHSDMYPESYLRCRSLLKGKGASIMSGVFDYPDVLIDKAKIKSNVDRQKNIYDSYYAPRRRTIQIHELMDIVMELDCISEGDKDRYFREKFYQLLLSVSLGWRKMCRDHEWQSHYGHEVMNITVGEMFRNLFTAHETTKEHLIVQGSYTLSRQRIMRRYIVRALLRMTIQIPLEAVGVWQVLRFVKRRIITER